MFAWRRALELMAPIDSGGRATLLLAVENLAGQIDDSVVRLSERQSSTYRDLNQGAVRGELHAKPCNVLKYREADRRRAVTKLSCLLK
jgi:hypothetical protein